MSRYARENPDEPPNHDWFQTARRLTDPRLCLRCGKNPKLPPLVWGGRVVAQPNLCRECEYAEFKRSVEKMKAEGVTLTIRIGTAAHKPL